MDEFGAPVTAEGVKIWREQVLTFFVNGTALSIDLRLLPALSNGGDICGTCLFLRRRNSLVAWIDSQFPVALAKVL